MKRKSVATKQLEQQGEKKHAITIMGNLGSGKTDVANILVAHTGFALLVVGQFFKDVSVKRNVEFHVLHEQMKTDLSIDLEMDEMQKEYLKNNTDYIIDSRLGKLFEPRAFGVFLQVDEILGAERIWKSLQTDPKRLAESGAKSIGDVLKYNRERVISEKIRYAKLYNGFDHTNLKHYDLIINTDRMTQPMIANYILDQFKAWRHGAKLC